ncbi:MAG: DUF1194 domain-containing protein [Bradyrhizobiaceae bacterium]|nr:DUF1194 domain-containing protein [Bradyrhizobiaceae bacterium]
MRRHAATLGILLLALGLAAPARSAEAVDLLLVLSADVSRSVDAEKFKLQRQGYADAFSDKRVVYALTSGPRGRAAVVFVEWAGAGEQAVVADWTLIDGFDSARRFGDKLVEAPRSFAGRTSISTGIDFAMEQFAHSPYPAERRIIDISGDGTHNSGRDVRAARDEAVAQGVVINGLVILSEVPLPVFPEHTHPPGGLENYFRENVIGGEGAFVRSAQNFEAFGRILISKLITEVALVPAPARVNAR